MGGLRTPVLAGVETVDGLFPQRIGDLFGILTPPTQKENRIAVVRNDFGRILVDGFQLRLALQDDGCRDFPAADGGDQLVEVGNLPDVGKLVQNQPYMDRQPTTVFIIRTVTQQIDKLALKHGENEVEGGVRVAHNQKQNRLFIPDGVQLYFIVLHQFPHFPDVKWG